MVASGIDAVWVDRAANLYYLTGSVQDAVLILSASGSYRYVVRKSLERARCESPLEAEPFRGRRALYESFGSEGSQLGIALASTTAADYLRLSAALGAAEIFDFSTTLRSLRSVKSPWEVEQIRCATVVGNAGFEVIPGILQPGIAELEISVEVEAAIRRAGHHGVVRCADPRFLIAGPTVVAGDAALYATNVNGSVGSEGCFPVDAGGAGRRVVRVGATVMADIVSTYNGYTADNTRIYFVGSRLPDRAARAHDFCLDCLRRIEERMKPGAVCEEIYGDVDRWAAASGKPEGFLGFGDNRMAFFGHGVGIEVDELPVIAGKVKTRLEPGMVIAVEPKAYLAGIGPVGVENTYVVTETGSQSLCDLDEAVILCG